MNKSELIEQVKIIVKPYINNQEAFENLSESTDFIKDLQINSANLVDVILDIEDHYKIEIDTVSMERIVDVKSALEIIESKVSEK
ncbi:MAG: acyl carrier protein [Flavobacterium sp.]|nr:acyl carrier protein [Flavobacterium sp.]